MQRPIIYLVTVEENRFEHVITNIFETLFSTHCVRNYNDVVHWSDTEL